MKWALIIAGLIVVWAMAGEWLLRDPQGNVARYEQTLRVNGQQMLTPGQRVMFYRTLQDRPSTLPDQWTAAECAVLSVMLQRLSQDFLRAPSGRLLLDCAPPESAAITAESAKPPIDFPLLAGIDGQWVDPQGNVLLRPSNAVGVLFSLLDAAD